MTPELRLSRVCCGRPVKPADGFCFTVWLVAGALDPFHLQPQCQSSLLRFHGNISRCSRMPWQQQISLSKNWSSLLCIHLCVLITVKSAYWAFPCFLSHITTVTMVQWSKFDTKRSSYAQVIPDYSPDIRKTSLKSFCQCFWCRSFMHKLSFCRTEY